MLRARRLPAVRTCLLVVSVVLLSTTVASLNASADPFGVVAPYHSHGKASKRRASREESSAARRARCATAARRRKHRKAGKACVVKKSYVSGAKRSATPKRSSSKPSVATTGTQIPVVGGAPPAEALDVPEEPGSEPGAPPAHVSKTRGSEPGSPSESPGGSGAPPVEELKPPVEESKAPVEEPKAPVEEPKPPVEEPVAPSAPFRFFSPASFWNEELPPDGPLDPSSSAVVGSFDEEIASEEQFKGGPWINTTKYSIPVYTVPAGQPTVAVQLVDHTPEAALSSAWSAVPLPPTATPTAGADGSLVVWQPSTDRLWEFHQFVHEANGWQASWGGAMQHVSSDRGVDGPEAWPGAQPWWGMSASSLSLVGGLISLEDLELGQINHALEMAIPEVRAGVYASPAQRSDGKSADPLSLPEGAHLRLNPNLNLAALHLPRLTLMLAEAAQRYGIVITDWSSVAEFYAQDPSPTGTNPYAGPDGYFEGKYPNQILASFPWSQLQLLKMELHSTP